MFSINKMFRKGALVHSRECGKAIAVSVTSFDPDLIALWFQALEICRFLYCSQVFFLQL